MDYLKKTVSFSKKASNIFFHILTQCNLKCIHCYINKKEHGTKTLDIETIVSWLKIFDEKKHKNIIFLGGEPTLNKDLPAAIKEAKKLNFRSITVDTNGYLFNDFLSKTKPSNLDYLSFSLDGASRLTNNKIRGKGSYETCIKGIKEAKKKGFNVSLIFTLSSLNFFELKMMPELAYDLKIDKFFIQIIGIRGKGVLQKDSIQISKGTFFKTIDETIKELNKFKINTVYPKVFLDENEPFKCGALVSDNYFIFPNGRVYRCPLCEDYPVHSLEIKENKLVKRPKINEEDLFDLNIIEGCVMNKIIQPQNIQSKEEETKYKIACCMLKEEITF